MSIQKRGRLHADGIYVRVQVKYIRGLVTGSVWYAAFVQMGCVVIGCSGYLL
jgi:hypothetical protein